MQHCLVELQAFAWQHKKLALAQAVAQHAAAGKASGQHSQDACRMANTKQAALPDGRRLRAHITQASSKEEVALPMAAGIPGSIAWARFVLTVGPARVRRHVRARGPLH